MEDDIRKLRPLCDVLVVAFHMGILHSPDIAMYEQQVSYAAIHEGADLVIGHHAHYLKGVEMYKGKAIFHGLGQFAPVGKEQTEERRKEMRSLAAPKVSTGYCQQDTAGFWTMIAKCVIDEGKITRVGYLPCLINAQKQPEILKNDERGRQAFEFMDKITEGAGLNTRYEWIGDEIVIRTDQT